MFKETKIKLLVISFILLFFCYCSLSPDDSKLKIDINDEESSLLPIDKERFIPKETVWPPDVNDVFTVAFNPFLQKNSITEFNCESFKRLVSRLQSSVDSKEDLDLPFFAEYRIQKGIIVLKNMKVYYWRVILENSAYLSGKCFGYIHFISSDDNKNHYYKLDYNRGVAPHFINEKNFNDSQIQESLRINTAFCRHGTVSCDQCRRWFNLRSI